MLWLAKMTFARWENKVITRWNTKLMKRQFEKNVKLMKWQVGKMTIWQKGLLMKCQVDEMSSWQNGSRQNGILCHAKLKKWLSRLAKMTICQNEKIKWLLNETLSWWKNNLTKCQVDEIASRQNVILCDDKLKKWFL